jgi:hypothetical protein
MSELASSTVPTSGSGAERGKTPCEVIFLRVFDLAYFFKDPSKDSSKRLIHFLEKRAGELSRYLFGYNKVAVPHVPPLYEDPFWDRQQNWEKCTDEKKRENNAYAAGWVRPC